MINCVNSYYIPNRYNAPVFKGATPQKKIELSTEAKVGIALGGMALTAAVCDLVFAKGKHIKSIFKSSSKKVESTGLSETPRPHQTSSGTTSQTSNPKIYTQPVLYDEFITPDRAKDLPKFNSFEEALANFRISIANPNVDKPKNAQELINSLKSHNYGQDNSLISVTTRTNLVDYNGKTIDISANKLYNVRIAANPTLGSGQKQVYIDNVGDYLIQNLSDGRKLVAISVPSGRFDGADCSGRPIRTVISILSKDKEFTPLQKDLIEIISQRKGQNFDQKTADILSFGVVSRNGSKKNGGGFDVNKDVLLSSIATAKNALNPAEIDKGFVTSALNLTSGDKLARFEFSV